MRCLPLINHHHVCPCSNPNLGYLVAKVPKRSLRSHPNEPTRENRKNGCKQLYVYRHSLNSLSNPGIGCFGPLSYYFRIFHNPRMTARLQPFIQHLHPGVVHQMRHRQRWDSCTGSFFKGMTWSARLPSELNMDHVKPGSIRPHFIQRASNFDSNLSHFWTSPTQFMIRVRQSRVDIKWQTQCHKPSHYSNHLRFTEHLHHPCFFYIGVYPQAWTKLTDSLSSLWLSHPWKIWYSLYSHWGKTSQS